MGRVRVLGTLRLRTRVVLLIVLGVAGVLGIAGTSAYQQGELDRIASVGEQAHRLAERLLGQIRLEQSFIVSADEDLLPRIDQAAGEARAAVAQGRAAATTSVGALLDRIEATLARHGEVFGAVAGNVAGIRQRVLDLTERFRETDARITGLVSAIDQEEARLTLEGESLAVPKVALRDALREFLGFSNATMVGVQGLLLVGDAEAYRERREALAEKTAAVGDNVERQLTIIGSPEYERIWTRAGTELAEISRIQAEIYDLWSANREFSAQLDATAREAERLADEVGQTSRELARTSHRSAGRVRLAVILATVACLSLLGWVLYRSVMEPVRGAVSRLRDIADGEGDLTQRLPVVGTDEFAELAGSFNRFADQIRGLVREVSGSSVGLASAAEQLSASTAQIASGSEQASSQVQAVATSAEEMSATVEEVAGNVGAVSEAADHARSAAGEGAEVVAQAVGAFREVAGVVDRAAERVRDLGEQSGRIGAVVEMIEDIADQTNLLALNAAIEAARAGDHGRGFAVVADEVRKLAEKTVVATREISGIVGTIQQGGRNAAEVMGEGQQAVVKGREWGERAAEAIQVIEGRVVTAADQARQIATASEELAVTIRQMAANMEEITRGVEQNSTAATEIARTADAVSRQAEELRAGSARFRT